VADERELGGRHLLPKGSAPTSYDLLLPDWVRTIAEQGAPTLLPISPGGSPFRSETSWVGSREFDAKSIRYSSTEEPGTFEFQVFDEVRVSILGNYNSGHDYGTENLSE